MSQYIGRDIGGYRIMEPIGVGGMAKVFKAYQPAFDRFVALKILPDHYAEDETYLQRFAQEARIIANLEQKYIVPVYDFGEDGGITYLAMRYLQAGTLKDVIKRFGGVMPLGDTARIISQVAGALDYAHEHGIVHRDIKPSNILIDREGDAYLTDFGIAKVLEATSHLTKTGTAMGTPAYMAPEHGMGTGVDVRSDVYSLGIVLYEMVTGRVPFEADTPFAVILAHANEPLPLPRMTNPSLPRQVERVILKALAKNPDDRYQTVGELAWALIDAIGDVDETIERRSADLLTITDELSNNRPSDQVTQDVRRRARRKPRSRRTGWVLAAVLGLLVVGMVIIGGLWLRRVAGQTAPDVEATFDALSTLAANPDTTLDPTQAVAFVEHMTATGQANIEATGTRQSLEMRLTATQNVVDENATATIIALTPTSSPTITPTPTKTATPTPVITEILLETTDPSRCDPDSGPAGLFRFRGGVGRWSTVDETLQVMAGAMNPQTSVDGYSVEPNEVTLSEVEWHQATVEGPVPGYGFTGYFVLTLEPGEHLIEVVWLNDQYRVCYLTVTE